MIKFHDFSLTTLPNGTRMSNEKLMFWGTERKKDKNEEINSLKIEMLSFALA